MSAGCPQGVLWAGSRGVSHLQGVLHQPGSACYGAIACESSPRGRTVLCDQVCCAVMWLGSSAELPITHGLNSAARNGDAGILPCGVGRSAQLRWHTEKGNAHLLAVAMLARVLCHPAAVRRRPTVLAGAAASWMGVCPLLGGCSMAPAKHYGGFDPWPCAVLLRAPSDYMKCAVVCRALLLAPHLRPAPAICPAPSSTCGL